EWGETFMSKFQPSTIKVGDAVLVGSSPERPRRIQKVLRVTETLFTLDNGDRYYRESGLRYGLMSGRILGLATPEDYVERERCRQQAQAQPEARERADRYKQALEHPFARPPRSVARRVC